MILFVTNTVIKLKYVNSKKTNNKLRKKAVIISKIVI